MNGQVLNAIFGVMFLILMTSIVAAEACAMLSAVSFAWRQTGMLAQRIAIANRRYEWASILFHEVYAASAGQPPAYKTSRAVAVFGSVVAAGIGSQLAGIASSGLGLVFGAALMTSITYFALADGRAFDEYRFKQQDAIANDTWAVAYRHGPDSTLGVLR